MSLSNGCLLKGITTSDDPNVLYIPKKIKKKVKSNSFSPECEA